MQYWLLKTEPEVWSWDNQVKKGVEKWDGVRNFQARNYMKVMKVKDLAFFYHTGKERKIVGIVEIIKEYYPDTDPNFVCVDVKTVKPANNIITLTDIKANPLLKDMVLVKNSRLSVQPVTKEEFNIIMTMLNEF